MSSDDARGITAAIAFGILFALFLGMSGHGAGYKQGYAECKAGMVEK